MYFNYVHDSRVEQTIKDILKDHSFNGDFHRANISSLEAVANYLDGTNSVTAWDMRTSDWPNMMGGEAFACWVEDGYLCSWQWSYQY